LGLGSGLNPKPLNSRRNSLDAWHRLLNSVEDGIEVVLLALGSQVHTIFMNADSLQSKTRTATAATALGIKQGAKLL
jgi:hypothetical protein